MNKAELLKQEINERRSILIKRVLLIWAVHTFSIVIVSMFYDGIQVNNFGSAIVLALIVGLVNAILWPLLSKWTLKINVYTLGLFNFISNGFIFFLSAELVPGVEIASFWAGIWMAIWTTVANTILSTWLSIDDDDSYFKNVTQKRLKKKYKPRTKKPGIIFLEIDGLGEPVLKRAMEKGYAPNLKRWIDEKSYHLKEWETDLSCQTGASQAGILLGSNKNMPAFRWVEKERNNKIMTSTGPKDCPELEKRHSNGKGLLAIHGGSRGNLFSGDASDSIFTYSTVLAKNKNTHYPSYYSYFSVPYNTVRTLTLAFGEMIREVKSLHRQKRENILPRLTRKKRNIPYMVLRSFISVVLPDLNMDTIIGDIAMGQNDSVYATFAGYDEVAHHSGVEDIDAFETLKRLDKRFAQVEKAVNNAERKYYLVVLSDHGQTNGATFKQRYGYTLEGLVKQAIGTDKANVTSVLDTNHGWGHLNVFLNDVTQDKEKLSSDAIKKLVRGSMYKGSVVMGPENKAVQTKPSKTKKKDGAIVLASGNLGLIYLTKSNKRMSYEQIRKQYPNLILSLAQHDGIGWLLVQSSKYGPLVIGKKGVLHLKNNKLEGEDPLANFDKNARRHILRSNSFKYMPDILVNSMYDKKKDEVAAFEELIGSHGGLGGNQSRPFVLYPKAWHTPKKNIVGAEELHKIMKDWLKQVK